MRSCLCFCFKAFSFQSPTHPATRVCMVFYIQRCAQKTSSDAKDFAGITPLRMLTLQARNLLQQKCLHEYQAPAADAKKVAGNMLLRHATLQVRGLLQHKGLQGSQAPAVALKRRHRVTHTTCVRPPAVKTTLTLTFCRRKF